jgi:hypothetical protein
MISPGVEISIAGGGEEMERELNTCLFFSSFFFFNSYYSLFRVQENCMQCELWHKQNPSQNHKVQKKHIHPGPGRPTHHPKSLWYGTNRTPATPKPKLPSTLHVEQKLAKEKHGEEATGEPAP